MPTTVNLTPLDQANPGDPGHVEDHNLLREAAIELQTLSNQHLLDSDIVAGANVTVTPGAGNSVTVAVPTAPSHTHSTYALEATPQTLQEQINDIVLNQGPVTIANLPAGSMIIFDYAKNTGAWGPRPSNRTDITVMWKGPTDPAQYDPNPVLAQDIWFNTA